MIRGTVSAGLNLVLTLLLTSLIAFALLYGIGDPATVVAGESADSARIAEVRNELGYDRPLGAQYVEWVQAALHGDLGNSLLRSTSVIELIGERIPVTLSLGAGALALAVLFSLLPGLVAGLHINSWWDHVISGLTGAAYSVPNFWLGMMLVLVFAVQLDLLPGFGYAPLSDGFAPWLAHLVLPSLALGTALAAEMVRMLRSSIAEAMQQPYIVTAKAKGVAMRAVVGKHALKNAMIPYVTVLGLHVARVLGGAVIIEKVFAIPGVGSLAADSVISRDIPVVLGVIMVIVLAVASVGALVDMSYLLLNPRARVQRVS